MHAGLETDINLRNYKARLGVYTPYRRRRSAVKAMKSLPSGIHR